MDYKFKHAEIPRSQIYFEEGTSYMYDEDKDRRLLRPTNDIMFWQLFVAYLIPQNIPELGI